MNPKDIKNVLKCCINSDGCENCPCSKQCDGVEHLTNALTYINQLEAEVERLRKILTVCTKAKNDYANQLQQVIKNLETAKSDAVKEFWEELKKHAYTRTGQFVMVEDGDNLVKEMVNDKNK